MNIAILGDYNPNYPPHPATTQSLKHASSYSGIKINITWIATEAIDNGIPEILDTFHAVWLGPAPYKNEPGVLKAVKYIRDNNFPFIGTCGGLYQSMIEFGINVLGLDEKLFKNRSPEADNDFFMIDTSCGAHGFKEINFRTLENTKTHQFYSKDICEEHSNCGFMINPKYFGLLEEHGLKISGMDDQNEAKVFELQSNVFFILTKFLPQMRSDINSPHPLVLAFIEAGAN
jgi:CTP synthase (UTP-ammonia lyase)